MFLKWVHYHLLNDALAGIQASLSHLHRKEDHIMAAIDDLSAAVQKIQDAVSAAVTDIQTLTAEIQAANSTNNDPAIEDAATRLNTIADTLNAAVNPPMP